MKGKWNQSGFLKKWNLKTQNKSMLVNEKYKIELIREIKSVKSAACSIKGNAEKWAVLKTGKFSKGNYLWCIGKGKFVICVAEKCWCIIGGESCKMCVQGSKCLFSAD